MPSRAEATNRAGALYKFFFKLKIREVGSLSGLEIRITCVVCVSRVYLLLKNLLQQIFLEIFLLYFPLVVMQVFCNAHFTWNIAIYKIKLKEVWSRNPSYFLDKLRFSTSRKVEAGSLILNWGLKQFFISVVR